MRSMLFNRCRKGSRLRWRAWVWLLALATGWAGPAHAQRQEQDVKAQVLFQVMLFVQWGGRAASAPDATFNFCVQDDSAFSQAMRVFEGRRINDRVFAWRRIGADQWAGCQAVYLGQAAAASPERRPDVRGVLLVGDELGLIERGAMVNMQVEGGKVVFDIGLDALRRSGLDISAKVLRLARYVKEP